MSGPSIRPPVVAGNVPGEAGPSSGSHPAAAPAGNSRDTAAVRATGLSVGYDRSPVVSGIDHVVGPVLRVILDGEQGQFGPVFAVADALDDHAEAVIAACDSGAGRGHARAGDGSPAPQNAGAFGPEDGGTG